MKIANDVRWLASGPRSGIHEIDIPSNDQDQVSCQEKSIQHNVKP